MRSPTAPTLSDVVNEPAKSIKSRAGAKSLLHVVVRAARSESGLSEQLLESCSRKMITTRIGVTLAADIACELRVRDRVAALAFGDVLVEATDDPIAVFCREDARTELEGLPGTEGSLVVSATNRSIVTGQAQFIVSGDLLLLDGLGLRRAAQSVATVGATTSVHLDRPVPIDSADRFENWRYLRRAGAAAHTQLRAGEGLLEGSGASASYAPFHPGRMHPLFVGDTVVVGLHSRTIVAATETEFTFDEPIADMLSGATFAWSPPEGERVAHAVPRGNRLASRPIMIIQK